MLGEIGGDHLVDEDAAQRKFELVGEGGREFDGLGDGHLFGEGDELDAAPVGVSEQREHVLRLIDHMPHAERGGDDDGNPQQIEPVTRGRCIDDDEVPAVLSVGPELPLMVVGLAEHEKLGEAGDDLEEPGDRLVFKDRAVEQLGAEDHGPILLHGLLRGDRDGGEAGSELHNLCVDGGAAEELSEPVLGMQLHQQHTAAAARGLARQRERNGALSDAALAGHEQEARLPGSRLGWRATQALCPGFRRRVPCGPERRGATAGSRRRRAGGRHRSRGRCSAAAGGGW